MAYLIYRRDIVIGLVASVVVFFALVYGTVVHAATYTVTKTTDDAPDGTCDVSDCSLREAVIAANANTGNDEIILSSGTYALTITNSAGDEDASATGDLDVTDSAELSVIGNGAGMTTIDASGITSGDRVVEVTSASASLVVTGVTIQGGSTTEAGGGIKTQGALTLTNSTVTGNTSSSDGGGILAQSTGLTIAGSTISNNTAARGGGMEYQSSSSQTLSITQTTVSGNTATDFGGGIYVDGVGDGTISESVISDNTASSAASGLYFDVDFSGGNILTLQNTTITESTVSTTGGLITLRSPDPDTVTLNVYFSTLKSASTNPVIKSSGSTSITEAVVFGTILSGNTDNCTGTTTITSNGYNIDSSNGCGFGSTGDQVSTDPLFHSDGLANNGGSTETIALAVTPTVSPAINVIPAAACLDVDGAALSTDQRAENRTGYCDVGAYEYQDSVSPVVTITNNTAEYNVVECTATYSDQGATATDAIDGTLTSDIDTTNTVNSAAPGSYSVVYGVQDLSTNAAEETRTVTVQDTIGPVVTLNGESAITLDVGDTYAEDGATATDTCDADVSVSTDGDVDTLVAGEYVVTYSSTDESGNIGEATRTVTVEANGNTDADGDGVTVLEGDCNDADASVSSEQTYYTDGDADGLGDPDVPTAVCSAEAPDGYVANASDTDDTIPNAGVEIADDGVDNDDDGDTDEVNTGTHPYFGSLTDVTNASLYAASILEMSGTAGGAIRVLYADNSLYEYTVFNTPSATAVTVVRSFDGTGHVLVLHPRGRKLALVDVYTGSVLDTVTLAARNQKSRSLKLLDLRGNEVTDVVVALKVEKRKASGVVFVVKVKTSDQQLVKKSHAQFSAKTVRVAKTAKKKKLLLLRNARSRVVLRYRVTPKLNLTLVR